MLNTAKGPAVHSLRAQADKHRYHTEMKKTIEQQENLIKILPRKNVPVASTTAFAL